MKVSCPSCQTNYNIDDKRIPPGGAKLKCARCQNTFPIKPAEPVSAPESAAIPLPGAAAPASAAIPLPGAAAPQASDPFGSYDDGLSGPPESEATRVVSMPVPSAAYPETAPPASAAIPLPGAADGGYSDAASGFDYASAPQSADLAYDLQSSPPGGQAIPLPGSADAGWGEPPPADSGFDYGAQDPYAAADPYAASDPYAMPPDPYATAPASESQADPYAMPPLPPTSEVDTFGLPPAPAEDPYAASSEDPFALPPPPAADPYAASSEDPFALPPPPAADPYAASSEDPFALPPMQNEVSAEADPFALPPPPEAAPAAVDFPLDFAEPPPAAGSASIPDSLEFDPSAPAMPAGDDLEADLSAPLPPPPGAGAADGLEMLSFIDDTAKANAGGAAKASGPRFQVRRRSGKVFGPFEEGVIVKMLEDGQLLGNEDVSTDGDSWTPIGTVPTFATAIQKLMEGPATPVAPASSPAIPSVEAKAAQANAPSMERLNQLYEGRMAAVAVVDNSSKAEEFKKRLPLLLGVAAAVAVVGIGFSFSLTRYGAFGLKKFLPSKVKAGTPLHASVESARKELLEDSFESYKKARELSAQVLTDSEYPEVRALWCQSVFYLQRRYSAATPAELSRCRAEGENLELLGEKNVEYVKYLAGSALTNRQPDQAIAPLQKAWSGGGQGDLELAFLLAEAQASKKQTDQAIGTLKRVLEKNPKSAKAHHALGNLYQATNKADEAVQAYTAALEADPSHVISAVELAAVELLLRQDAQKGFEAAERALDEKLQAEMGPAELSRARALKGIALFQQHKLHQAEEVLRAALKEDPSSVFTKGYLARVLRAQRQYAEALPFYQEAAAAEPQNIEYTDGHINALVVTGNMQEAVKVVEAANTRFAGNARIAYLFGRIEDARDNSSTAEAHYKRAIAADAELFEANLYLGRFYLRLRRTQDAREQFEQAASKAPKNAGVRAGLGELALAEGNIPLAQEEFNRAAEYDPNLADAHLGLSRLALLAGDLETAQKEADTALELDSHLKEGRLQRGLVLWRLGRLDDAIAELEKAKEEDPRSVQIPITLGAVHLDKGNNKDAESNLLLALDRERSNPEAHYYMARVKFERGEHSQAIDSMKNAVERAPKRADYRYVLGTFYHQAKQPLDAIEQWNEAVTLDPRLADAHESLGKVYLERAELDKAITAFQAALKADPQRIRALGAIGDTHFTALRWRDAIRSYEKALKSDPSLTYIFYKMGRCYTEQVQHSRAIPWYVKATKAEPDNALAWYHLGFAYKEKGKRKDAVKAFKEYLARKPDAVDRKDVEDEIAFLE